ncbi:MAG: TadE family protein [Myxococcota bacterium]
MRGLKTQRGAALTEFAILMPLLIAVFYGSVYLVDLGLFRIKTQEVARFSTWSFAQQPLSDYDSSKARHDEAFTDARDRVSDQVGSLYLDLDAARTRILPGAERQTASAILDPTRFDLRQKRAPILPELGNVDVPAPNATVGLILGALGLGGTTNDVVAGFFERAGLNGKGLVTGRASVRVLPPLRPADASRLATLSRVGASRGFDMDTIVSRQQGRLIRDGSGPVDSTLLVDSWRLNAGYSALPTESVESRRGFAHVVERFHSEAPKVLPGGGLIGGIFGIIGTDNAGKYVVSRPYLDARSCNSVNRTRFDEQAGQVNPFRRSGISRGRLQETGAVTTFETLPLFDDPAAMCSPMVQALNDRGNNFMGCQDPQKRRCR